MQPLNQPERRTRLWQFSLLYLLALAVPLGASYYLFSNTSLADENARLKKELDRTQLEQTQLVVRFDTLTRYLQRIDALDQRLRGESNDVLKGQLATTSQDYLNAIAANLSQLRVDSAQLQVPAHRLLVRDELRAFTIFRASRSTIDAVRGQLTQSGNVVQQNARLAEELAQSRQQVVMLQATLGRPSAAAPAPPPSGGGGGGASAGAKLQIALLQDQVAFANADCIRQRALATKSHKDRKHLLEEARTAFIAILQDPATDDFKQSIEKTLEPINIELGRPPRFFGLIPN